MQKGSIKIQIEIEHNAETDEEISELLDKIDNAISKVVKVTYLEYTDTNFNL